MVRGSIRWVQRYVNKNFDKMMTAVWVERPDAAVIFLRWILADRKKCGEKVDL